MDRLSENGEFQRRVGFPDLGVRRIQDHFFDSEAKPHESIFASILYPKSGKQNYENHQD